ncbi:hypothetical protein WA577_003554 [Blastocystis sp. JDR]
MKCISVLFALLCAVALCSELRMESSRPFGRSLEESSIPFTACGTWDSGCRSTETNSFKTTIRFNGKDKEVPTGIVITSMAYSGAECSGNAVLDEEITYGFESMEVKDLYPYALTVARNVSSFSVKFNEWKYFGKDVTCTNMELGKTYSLADAQCVDGDGKDVFEILRSTESGYNYYFFDGNVLRDNDSSAYDYSSSKGCSQPMTWLVWVVVVVVVVIVIVVIVVLVMSNKKKEMKKQPKKEPKEEKKPESVSVEMKAVEVKPAEVKPVEVKPAEEKTEEKPVELKPAETKPVEEAKPTEVKPAEEVKPEEVKPEEKTEEKPAEEVKPEEKPAEEVKPEEKPVEEVKPEKPAEEVNPEEKPAEDVKP